MAKNSITGLPLISNPTRSESTNIETVLSRINSGRIVIPDYQRDAEQWDVRKESLFIESILNNLTIPGFFFSEKEDGVIEVVDGQQRLNTIRKFANNDFAISDDEEIVYLTPQSIHYSGKLFKDIPTDLQTVFNDYPLTVIYLPKGVDLNTKLEIFRRINEGGTPLTGQDIRLSYYSDSNSVYFIRIAGVHTQSSSTDSMLTSAKKRGIENPWLKHPNAWNVWKDWWEDKTLAKGQTPSEMFLWYLIFRNRINLDRLLSNPSSMRHLGISFRGTTDEALDIYCSQLKYTDGAGGTQVFPTYGKGLEEEFSFFASSIESVLNYGLPGISVDKYKQLALVIGAIAELNKHLSKKISSDAWNMIGQFIRTPRKTADALKSDYPEQRGRWTGLKGQKGQCDAVLSIISKIFKKHG